jgi:hypothetical protein
VITGATPGTVRLKLVGAVVETEFVAVTRIDETATELGVPVSKPELLRLAQLGSPLLNQVIGLDPDAANWNV